MTTRQAYSAIARLFNDEWWTHQLKGQRMRWHEALLIAVGEVNKDRSPYASKHAIRDVRARRQANLEFLKSCDLENRETGERIDLISKVMGSISNPEIRRMELMNTIAGIERYAAAEGDVGMFITLTAPSKYHPTRQVGKGESKTVQLNHGWNDEAFNPKDAQRYLCRIWSLMRTAFKDNDLQVYGLRVVEPHHDGTPHWHMMLFCNPRQRNQIIEIMRRYALKEDGDERGAARNRFQAKHLNRGGAAGYIAKYISKNIDGYALDGQLDNDTGKPLKDTAAAVTAWASTWRIPQFKTVGLPTMGAYRELRKLPRASALLMSLTSASRLHAPPQTVVILRCISARRVGQMSRAIVRLSGSPVARRMTLTSTRKRSREWSAFTRRISARVIFISPERRTGALFRKCRSLSL